MVADRFPHHFTVPVLRTGTPHQNSMGLHGCWLCSVPLLHVTPWMLAVLRSTHTNVADKNRYYTSIHHVSRADQNYAVLKRAENIMRHVEMWSVVRQKETVRASRKINSARVAEDVLRVEGFSNVGIPARLRTIRPKPIDILAVGIVHHVCLQKLEGWCCTRDHER